MADNTVQNGTDTIATDDVTTLNGAGSSGIKVQRVKAGFGVENTYTDVTSTTPLPIQVFLNTSSTGTPTSPTVTAASTAALASNTVRRGATFFNDSNVDVLLALGFTTLVTAYTVRLLVGGYYELPSAYTGAVNMMGVAPSTTTATSPTTGGLRVTEIT